MSFNNGKRVPTEAVECTFPLVSDSLFNEKIAYGISALKKLPEWPREREKEIPLCSDVSATIFLEITPKKMFNPYMPGVRDRVCLPNELSYKRSVCVLQRDEVIADHGASTIEALKELGVDGKIKIIPTSLIREAIYQNDQDALKELAQLYDTHIGKQHHLHKFERVLEPLFNEQGKYLIRLYGDPYAKINLQIALSKVAYCTNAEKNGFVTKIAHCGYTDAQVAANVLEALKVYEEGLKFGPLKEKTPKLVCLKIGNSEGVVIYASDNANKFQTKISKGIESQQLEKTDSYKRTANGEASPISAPKKNKLNSTNAAELPTSAENGKESNFIHVAELPIST